MKRVLRLVADTSVIVAAFRSRNGASAGLLHASRAERLAAVATPTLSPPSPGDELPDGNVREL